LIDDIGDEAEFTAASKQAAEIRSWLIPASFCMIV